MVVRLSAHPAGGYLVADNFRQAMIETIRFSMAMAALHDAGRRERRSNYETTKLAQKVAQQKVVERMATKMKKLLCQEQMTGEGPNAQVCGDDAIGMIHANDPSSLRCREHFDEAAGVSPISATAYNGYPSKPEAVVPLDGRCIVVDIPKDVAADLEAGKRNAKRYGGFPSKLPDFGDQQRIEDAEDEIEEIEDAANDECGRCGASSPETRIAGGSCFDCNETAQREQFERIRVAADEINAESYAALPVPEKRKPVGWDARFRLNGLQ